MKVYNIEAINQSLTHDFDVTVSCSEDQYKTEYSFSINRCDYCGTIEEQIMYHLEQPTIHGKVKEVMERDIDKLRKETEYKLSLEQNT